MSNLRTKYLRSFTISEPTDFDDSKQKRAGGGNVGLFPFPRVGRSDPDMISEYESPYNAFNPFDNYDGECDVHLMKFNYNCENHRTCTS